ncbi:MAG: hypothetical protein QXV84_04420 [Conexivisphaerales archaeon]
MLSKRQKSLTKRRAIAGIVAAVILFAMLFTTGLAFFLFLNNENLLYSQSLVARSNKIQASVAENLLITVSTKNGYISFTINNQGGISSTAVAVLVTNQTGYVYAYYNSTSSGLSSSLPISINPGSVSSTLTTQVKYSSGTTYVIKVITSYGNVFQGTYPPTATALAAQALSSGAIGDLYLSFQSYYWYNVTQNNCPAAGTQVSGGISSGYCLVTPGKKAFSISYAAANSNAGIAFSVTVTDLNPQQQSITLDQYTLLEQIMPGSGSDFKAQNWFIVSNSSNVILSSYSPITLQYNVPVTLVFASSGAGSFGPQPASFSGDSSDKSNSPKIPFTVLVFISTHGCEGSTSCSPSNYGQNSPYVTTLYY